MTKKFNLQEFLKEEREKNPNFAKNLSNWANRRDIISNPVACVTGEECIVPSLYTLIADGARYRCKNCGRTFEFIIPPDKPDGTWNKSGWYLLSPSIFDIIKAWFKF